MTTMTTMRPQTRRPHGRHPGDGGCGCGYQDCPRLPWRPQSSSSAASPGSADTLCGNTMSHRRQQRAAAFAAGAKQGVINMTSLDFNKAKEDVARVIDSSTGEFRDDFQQRAADFTKVVEQSKVVTEGTVNATAVESMNEHSAVVLVAATSRVTNSAGAKDEPRAWRLKVTVTEEGGQYKMSKVEFVP